MSAAGAIVIAPARTAIVRPTIVGAAIVSSATVGFAECLAVFDFQLESRRAAAVFIMTLAKTRGLAVLDFDFALKVGRTIRVRCARRLDDRALA